MGSTQRPLRLLSLDGGGIRGLSGLYILKSIMIALAKEAGQPPNQSLCPYEYFDLMAGTSTGGLIAVMLGTLRLDIDTCIREYLNIAPRIFPVEDVIGRSKLGRFVKAARGQQRFDAAPLELAIKHLVKKYLGDGATTGDDTPFRFESYDSREASDCKVFVCVTSEKLGRPFRFRSYESSWDAADDCPIWQACRATSAAPTFFPPIDIGWPPTTYIDGGLGYNNPIRALMDEASHLWPQERNIRCIVSIGTGVLMPRDVGRNITSLFECLKNMATDTEKVAQEFEEEMKFRKNWVRRVEGDGQDESGDTRLSQRSMEPGETLRVPAVLTRKSGGILWGDECGGSRLRLADLRDLIRDSQAQELDTETTSDQRKALEKELLIAAQIDNNGMVKSLLEKGVDVNAQGGMWGSALKTAVSNSNLNIARMLLERGANINARCGSLNCYVIEDAVGSLHPSAEMVQMLVDYGANTNAQNLTGLFGNALQRAVCNRHLKDERILRILLENGADVNARSLNYGSALETSVKIGNKAFTRLLLEHGAMIFARKLHDNRPQEFKYRLIKLLKSEDQTRELGLDDGIDSDPWPSADIRSRLLY